MISRFNFGKSLQVAQIKRGVSSVELASRMGITKQQVSHWRHRNDGKLSLVSKLCHHLEMHPYEFLDLSDDKKN